MLLIACAAFFMLFVSSILHLVFIHFLFHSFLLHINLFFVAVSVVFVSELFLIFVVLLSNVYVYAYMCVNIDLFQCICFMFLYKKNNNFCIFFLSLRV